MAVSSDLLRGVAETEVTPRGIRPHRLPAWVRQQFPDGQLLAMESQPSGVRLVFRTAASTLDLVTHPTRITYLGAERSRGRIDVYVDGVLALRDPLGGGDRVEVDLTTGQSVFHPGQAHTTRVSGLPAGRHRIEVWLPHNESVELVDLRADARSSRTTPPCRCGYTTAAPSVTARTRSHPARPGRPSPPAGPASSCATSGWAAARSSTRSWPA